MDSYYIPDLLFEDFTTFAHPDSFLKQIAYHPSQNAFTCSTNNGYFLTYDCESYQLIGCFKEIPPSSEMTVGPNLQVFVAAKS